MHKVKVGLLGLLLIVCNPSWAQNVRISTFEQETVQIDIAINIMESIYKRLGHTMTIVRFPAKRSLVEANLGTVNGELIRVEAIEEQAANLIRIPFAIGRLKVVAITRTGQPKVKNMTGLKSKRVGILRGVEFTDQMTKHLDRQALNSIKGLFDILLSSRVDVILFPELDALQYIKFNDLEYKLDVSTFPIMEVELYHFIHKSSKALADQLFEEMKEMDQSGELAVLIETVEQAQK
jgi:polar amino acid transport system substrate-binding protein